MKQVFQLGLVVMTLHLTQNNSFKKTKVQIFLQKLQELKKNLVL